MSRHRPAFTIVELLVVIAIIGVLVGILMPAVQAAREAARRSECANHLKQIGLAMQNHHTSQGRFPAGTVHSNDDGDPTGTAGYGWFVYLLPYLEEKDLYNRLNLPVSELHDILKDPANRELVQVPLPLVRCPSDSSIELNDQRPFSGAKYGDTHAGRSNYIGNHGTHFVTLDKQLKQHLDSFGMLYPESRLSMSNVPDGTSKTILVGERTSKNLAGVWAGVRSYYSDGDDGLRMNLGISDTPINAKTGGSGGFSSEHSGGAFFVFVDGHVDFIDEQIGFNQTGANSPDQSQLSQIGLYQRLLRRNDGQLCHGWR
jgi:prepilin-type N-terminal cleavage/methylation domain-containing protein/prepilin-type processing-associated H-X9-DG protein